MNKNTSNTAEMIPQNFRFIYIQPLTKLAFPHHAQARSEASFTGLQHGLKAVQNPGTPSFIIITVKCSAPRTQSGKSSRKLPTELFAKRGTIPALSYVSNLVLCWHRERPPKVLAGNQHPYAVVLQTYPQRGLAKAWLVKYFQSIAFNFHPTSSPGTFPQAVFRRQRIHNISFFSSL